jgi:hypothetical protein
MRFKIDSLKFCRCTSLPNRLNNFLAGTHFILTAVGFVLIRLSSNAFDGLAIRLGVLSFLTACVAFVVNIGWAAIKPRKLN